MAYRLARREWIRPRRERCRSAWPSAQCRALSLGRGWPEGPGEGFIPFEGTPLIRRFAEPSPEGEGSAMADPSQHAAITFNSTAIGVGSDSTPTVVLVCCTSP